MFIATQKYTETGINTSSPARLVLILYDGAISSTLKAKRCIEAGDIEGKSVNTSRAMNIIYELMNSLDMAVGGEMAANLHNLYSYCIDRLLQASMKWDAQPLDSVARVLCTLREGWEGVVKAEAEGALAQP